MNVIIDDDVIEDWIVLVADKTGDEVDEVIIVEDCTSDRVLRADIDLSGVCDMDTRGEEL